MFHEQQNWPWPYREIPENQNKRGLHSVFKPSKKGSTQLSVKKVSCNKKTRAVQNKENYHEKMFLTVTRPDG